MLAVAPSRHRCRPRARRRERAHGRRSVGGDSQFPRPHVGVSGRRYYSPSQGRFLGRDPIDESGGWNLYGFCGNNAINLWDYLGMVWVQTGTIGFASALQGPIGSGWEWISSDAALSVGDVSDFAGLGGAQALYGDALQVAPIYDADNNLQWIQFSLSVDGVTVQQRFTPLFNQFGHFTAIDFGNSADQVGFGLPTAFFNTLTFMGPGSMIVAGVDPTAGLSTNTPSTQPVDGSFGFFDRLGNALAGGAAGALAGATTGGFAGGVFGDSPGNAAAGAITGGVAGGVAGLVQGFGAQPSTSMSAVINNAALSGYISGTFGGLSALGGAPAPSVTGNGGFVLTGMTKAQARTTTQGLGLAPAQASAVNSAISRATTTSSISVTQYGPNAVVQIMRPGADNGFQIIHTVVTPSGAKLVVQKAYDDAGKLVHYHPKP